MPLLRYWLCPFEGGTAVYFGRVSTGKHRIDVDPVGFKRVCGYHKVTAASKWQSVFHRDAPNFGTQHRRST
jgi:hypothetical protein